MKFNIIFVAQLTFLFLHELIIEEKYNFEIKSIYFINNVKTHINKIFARIIIFLYTLKNYIEN
jgi:hypothetical protein